MLIDYPYIKAYGKYVGLSEAKILEQINKAQNVDAPEDVVRLLPNGNWTRLEHYNEQWQKRLKK